MPDVQLNTRIKQAFFVIILLLNKMAFEAITSGTEQAGRTIRENNKNKLQNKCRRHL